jgi:hypothetical protein
VLKHCPANRKRRISALPNAGPYIYDVKISGFIKSSIYVVCKKFGEWYQKTNKIEVTNKLTLLAFNSCHTFLDCRCVAAIQERVTAVEGQ